jgi:CubicO group peptidase (beta-lactamase class C family)
MIAPLPELDRRHLLAALAVSVALPAGALARTAKAGQAAVKAMADRYVAERKVANVVVAVGGPSGPPDFVSAGRLALGAGAPAGPDSLYRIYSMTKPITGCAIMMLVEDGKLSLDQPLSGIFPGFSQMNVLTDPANSLATRPAAKPILIRHLLTHTAGFTYTIIGNGPLQKLYAEKGIVPAQTSIAAEAQEHRPPNLIAFAEAVAPLPLLVEPGSAWNYSIALDVAGAVVEKVSGMGFDTFLQQRIFTPLGMADTFFTVPASKLPRMASNYSVTDKGLEPLDVPPATIYARPPAFPYGGAGLVSSARDYARFMQALLGGGQLGRTHILKPETARLMMSNLLEPGVKFGADSGYGAGGRSTLVAVPGGEGAGTYGWSGAAGTHAFVDRSNGLYVVMMTQFMGSPNNPLVGDLTTAVYKDHAAA